MLRPDQWISLFEEAGFTNVEAHDSGANVSALPESILAQTAGDDDHGKHPYPKGPIHIIAGTKPTNGMDEGI